MLNVSTVSDAAAAAAAAASAASHDPKLWWIGLALDCVATLAGTVGKLLLRYAAVSGRWHFYLVGLFLTAFIDPAFDMSAYSFTAQSIIAAAAGLVVVWNVILAPFVLDEVLTRSRAVGAALIFTGTVGVGVFGSHDEVDLQPQEYLALFLRTEALLYYAAFAAWTGCCVWFCGVPVPGSGYLWPNTVFVVPQRGSAELRGFLLVAFAGSLAGNSFVTKAWSELIVCDYIETSCSAYRSIFTDPFFYLFGAGSLTVAAFSLFLLAIALRFFEALYMITVFEGFYVITGALSGNFVLDEKAGQSPLGLSLYAASIGLIVCGMCVLCRGEWSGRRDSSGSKAAAMADEGARAAAML
jgi:hypothetical protein